jgi:hypothetical protein
MQKSRAPRRKSDRQGEGENCKSKGGRGGGRGRCKDRWEGARQKQRPLRTDPDSPAVGLKRRLAARDGTRIIRISAKFSANYRLIRNRIAE